MSDITAFPCHGSMGEVVQEGMTLRMWLAGHAMVFVARSAEMEHVGPAELAAACFEYADAMLIESAMPGPAREDYERQIESATARADRMAATLRRLVDALSPTQILAGEAPLVDAIAVLDDDEMIPF